MGHGYGAQLAGFGCELRRAGQLGSHVHNGDQAAAAVVKGLEALEIRIFQIVRVLRAPLLVGKVGALHLDAPQHRAALRLFLLQLYRRGKGLGQHLIGQGHGGRRKGGHAAACIKTSHLLQTFVIPIGEVRAGVAVAVDIDHAGDNGCTLQIHGIIGDISRQDCTENAVLHLEGAMVKPKIRTINSGVGIEHITHSLSAFAGSIPPPYFLKTGSDTSDQPITVTAGAKTRPNG